MVKRDIVMRGGKKKHTKTK